MTLRRLWVLVWLIGFTATGRVFPISRRDGALTVQVFEIDRLNPRGRKRRGPRR